jgi:hypothetical protein
MDADLAFDDTFTAFEMSGIPQSIRFADAFRFSLGPGVWSNPVLKSLDEHAEFDAIYQTLESLPVLAYSGNDLRVETGQLLQFRWRVEFDTRQHPLGQTKRRKRGVFLASNGYENRMRIRIPHK